VYDNDNIYFYEYVFFPLSPTRKLVMSKMVGVLPETGTAYPPQTPHFTCVLPIEAIMLRPINILASSQRLKKLFGFPIF
jgi:hypothetical protein